MLNQKINGFLNTPPLWINEQFGIQQFVFPHIDSNTFKALPIPSNRRLGHQMEFVFKQLIDHCDTYELVLYNLPIKDEKRTIGEIDFILREAALQKLLHIELTYKFYIINPEISEPIHRLMGPNRRDMFFTKMEKIKNQQFSLLHSPEGAAALEALEIDHKNIHHKACFKAQLFIPFRSDMATIRPLNTACIIGYWLRFDAFNSAEFAAYRFYIPIKTEWPMAPHSKVQWTSHFEVLMDLNLRMLRENAPMLWIKKNDTTFEKCFVVWW